MRALLLDAVLDSSAGAVIGQGRALARMAEDGRWDGHAAIMEALA